MSNDNSTAATVRLATALPGPRSLALMSRRANALPRGVNITIPIFVARAEGAMIEDVDGNRLLDFAGGISCVNVGHAAPAVVKAIQGQTERFLHTCFMVNPYESYIEAAELLNRQTPGDYAKKTMFVNSGAEAVENAVKIARAFTGKPAIIAFDGGFHGRTLLTMSLTAKTHPYKAGFGPFAPEIYRLPYAYCYRCDYKLTYPSCGLECAHQLREMFLRGVAAESVAAVIFEPILGEGGFVVPPPDWFQEIVSICREHGIVVIVDEIQTGFGRTGTNFVCEQFQLVPDIMVTAKSIAAGLPLAAVTGRAEIMDAPVPGGLGGTFGGNPVACAAAIASWDTLQAQGLVGRARRFSEIFGECTRTWPQRFSLIGDIRGKGAMQAIELVEDRGTKAPAAKATAQVLGACHKRGLVIISAGMRGNVIRLLAPLAISDSQIREGLAILEDALAEVHQAIPGTFGEKIEWPV